MDTGRGHSRGNRKPVAPRLLLQVDGWMAAYPVALDRLGVFSRTIRLQKSQVSMISCLFGLLITQLMALLSC